MQLAKKLEINFLYQVHFSGRSETRDGRPDLWLAEICLNSHLNSFGRNSNKNKTSSTKFVLFRSIRKQRWPPRPLIRYDIWSMTGNKKSMFSTEFVFFRPIGKPRWPSRCLIGLGILHSSEQISTIHDRKEDLNVLYQVLLSGQSIDKVALCTLVYDIGLFWSLVWQ